MILYYVLFMDCSRSVDVQIVLCSHCQHVTSGTEREREERTQTRQIGLLSNQLGNLGKYGDTTRHLRSCGAGDPTAREGDY